MVENLQERGIEFISQKENIESTTNTGRFILTVFGAIAELERDFILQRQREGIEIAKLAGVYKGRKPIDCPDFDKVYQQVELGKISATEAFTAKKTPSLCFHKDGAFRRCVLSCKFFKHFLDFKQTVNIRKL